MYQNSKDERKIIMKKNTNNSNNKNVSARRKLIPAVAMLATSAAMLSTSTYAWFTMSKEVEVTGINMTDMIDSMWFNSYFSWYNFVKFN